MARRMVCESLVALLACAWLPVSSCEAQDTAQAPPKKAASGAEKTFDAIKQLRQALAEWRKEPGPDGKVAAEDVEELQLRLKDVGRDLEQLLSVPRTPSQTAVRPAAAPEATALKDQWLKDVRALGLGAEERRAEAVTALREALAGNDASQQLAALRVLAQTGDVKFDRTPFRALILPLTESTERELPVAAFYALYNVDRRADDLTRVQAAYARQPEALTPSVSHLLFSFSDGAIEGASEKIVLELLASRDRNTRRETLRGLWGAKVTPQLAARLVELADDAGTRHDAIYFGLSTLKDKNEAVVDALIEVLADPDWNNWQRALWGLGHGVPQEHQAKVAKALVEMHNTRADARVRQDCARLVRQYGGEAMAAKLDK